MKNSNPKAEWAKESYCKQYNLNGILNLYLFSLLLFNPMNNRKIRKLSQSTINKIAAGEVVERPASVVKELLENAIDSNATKIVLELKGSGKEYIKISDNGCNVL